MSIALSEAVTSLKQAMYINLDYCYINFVSNRDTAYS